MPQALTDTNDAQDPRGIVRVFVSWSIAVATAAAAADHKNGDNSVWGDRGDVLTTYSTRPHASYQPSHCICRQPSTAEKLIQLRGKQRPWHISLFVV